MRGWREGQQGDTAKRCSGENDNDDNIELSNLLLAKSTRTATIHYENQQKREGCGNICDSSSPSSSSSSDDDEWVKPSSQLLIVGGAFVACSTSLLLVVPTVLLYITWVTYSLTGKIWCCSFFVIHLFSIVTTSNKFLQLPSPAVATARPGGGTGGGGGGYRTSSNRNFDTHLCYSTSSCCWRSPSSYPTSCSSSFGSRRRCSSSTCITTTALLLLHVVDLLLFGFIYPKAADTITQVLFTDDDNTVIIEWGHIVRDLYLFKISGYVIVGLRCCLGLIYLYNAIVVCKKKKKCCNNNTDNHTIAGGGTTANYGGEGEEEGDNLMSSSTSDGNNHTIENSSTNYGYLIWDFFLLFPPKQKAIASIIGSTLRHAFAALTFVSILLLVWCILAIISHFGKYPSSNPSSSLLSWQRLSSKNSNNNKYCDPLDSTECILPFPSFHYLREDPTTKTGYRVDIDRRVLPLMKGGISWKNIPELFISKLDGFSTMAPMLFYLDGMKEGHELLAAIDNTNTTRNINTLQGPERIEHSVTSTSVTLLLDVTAMELVYHSAEIDYLDLDRPLVLVFPSKPLKHNTHYAVAVINATDGNGRRIINSPFIQQQQQREGINGSGDDDSTMDDDHDRRQRMREQRFNGVIIPSLEIAAPWFSFSKDPESLQLLFDFHTISEESQLGIVRGVRDGTLSKIATKNTASSTWDWKDHIHTILVQEGNCSSNTSFIARTVHAEIDVPWFLETYGRDGRSVRLDTQAVLSKHPVTIGKAKFMVRVPCSLREAAIGGIGGKKLRAIMEYGHGLFGSREEVKDQFLSRMANDNGYILTAMDWRGMSKFDLPVVMKVMLGEPNLFGAVCDNIVQGFANKLALQHFSANHLLKMDWLMFEHSRIPLWHYGKTPARVFYGISQGGILGTLNICKQLEATGRYSHSSKSASFGHSGAGYTALSGPTKLIDRAVLGVPGTPFALVMSRSLDFITYDMLLLLSFYNNRHVRIFLSLMQMGWDSVEASGLLAPPVNEQYPRLLLQAGLGDPVVPTSSAEALARALGAKTLPNNPRQIFGISASQPSNQTWMGPDVTLTEVLYEKEYTMLPKDDMFGPTNNVHICVRLDKQLQHQLTEFVNSDRIIDPCKEDECRRNTTC